MENWSTLPSALHRVGHCPIIASLTCQAPRTTTARASLSLASSPTRRIERTVGADVRICGPIGAGRGCVRVRLIAEALKPARAGRIRPPAVRAPISGEFHTDVRRHGIPDRRTPDSAKLSGLTAGIGCRPTGSVEALKPRPGHSFEAMPSGQ
jgi:hypothetical protein